MKPVLLVRYGELHLKGQNRPFFERKLLNAMKSALRGTGAQILRAQGRYYVTDFDIEAQEELISRLQKIFGIHSISPARCVKKEIDIISQNAIEMVREEIARRGKPCTFKVIPRRSDKSFPINSTAMAPMIGGHILQAVEGASVDVHNPEIPLGIEIREEAYLYTCERPGAGGMPPGCNGRATLLLSGGIDSPVAGYMAMKRGLEIECVHFESAPYTSARSREKVVELARILSGYIGYVKLHIVPFTDVQLAIYDCCPANFTTIIMRRAMMQIAQSIAIRGECKALITGEAVGQVASQTLEGLVCTDNAVDMPVFRPLIGFDKIEIIERARAIGTYETSILPYEDCCTIFTPKHPSTKPALDKVIAAQTEIENWDELLSLAVEATEVIEIFPSRLD